MIQTKVKILQLVDDEKFTDCIISIFDKFSETIKSDFVVLSDASISCLKWVAASDRVRVVCRTDDAWLDLLNDGDYNFIWIHSLTRIKGEFVVESRLKKSRCVIWSAFGWDYLQFLELPLLKWRSLLENILNMSFRTMISFFMRRFFSLLHLDFVFWPSWAKVFFKCVDFYSCVLEEEWPLMRRILGNRPKTFKFHYISPDDMQNLEYTTCNYENKEIWIGNSATATNNFYDLFPLVKNYTDWNINVPLSYGPMTKQIDLFGRDFFQDRWHTITGFLPFSEYKKKMSSCSIFIFGHRRQQALGNILISLMAGGCVFLDAKSPTYHHFIGHGICVYTLADLKHDMLKCFEHFRDRRLDNVNRVRALQHRYWHEVEDSVKRIIS